MGYATQQDAVDYGLVPSALGLDVTPAQVQKALDTRSAYADGKMRARYGYQNVPLPAPYDPSIVQAVVHLATFDLLSRRGFDQANPNDVAVKIRYDAAVKFFDDVERQTQHPNVAIAAAPSTASAPPVAQPFVTSLPLQGWIPDPNGAPSNPGNSGIM